MKSRWLSTFIVFATCFTLLQVIGPTEAEAAETKINIVVLGDSYSSGTGGTSYYGKSGCYRSNYGYGEQYKKKISGMDVNFINLACQGNKIDGLSDQLFSLSRLEMAATDLVFVTVGGNDGGFERVVKQCLVDLTNSLDGCVRAVNDGEANLGAIIVKTKQRLNEIATMMPEAKIVLVGYPQLIDDRPGVCDYAIRDHGLVYQAGEQIRQLGMKLEAEQAKLISRMGSRFEFVSLKQLFSGHEVCGDQQQWIRDNFDTPIVYEWWHPNREGYAVIANHLYSKAFHDQAKDVFRYGNLPLACGYVLPYVSTYGTMDSNGYTDAHQYAVDMPAVAGSAVLSPVSGIAYRRYSSGYGNYIDVHGDDGRVHRMAHMQGTGLIASGSSVSKGQKLGLVGNTGYSTGPHLHYEQHIGGKQVKVILDGPGFEWGTAMDSGGYRRTLHTVESGNCGGPSDGGTDGSYNDSANELLIYSADSGRRYYHSVNPDGSQQAIGHTTWSKDYDIIVPIEFDGDPYSELVFFKREVTATRGSVATYHMTARGLERTNWKSDWLNSWSHLVPIDLDGDKLDEVILYSATSGRFFVFDVRKNGSMKAIREGYWSKGWSHIVPLEFDGDRGEEVLFYKEGKTRGRALLYGGGSTSIGTHLQTFSWVNGWSHIVPVDIEGNGDDELIIYNARTGSMLMHDVLRDGRQVVMVRDSWTRSWEIILPLEFDGDRGSEMLFYSDRTGKYEKGRTLVYDMNSKDISTRLQSFNWINGWSHIVAVQLPR